jgi:hypothetical protein
MTHRGKKERDKDREKKVSDRERIKVRGWDKRVKEERYI